MIPERIFNIGFYLAVLAFAVYSQMSGEIYWITLVTRAVIFGIAGIGLNLALGYGGLISFGHAAFFGIGGYAMGILAFHAQSDTPIFDGVLAINGTTSMLIIWLVALIAGGLAALLIGFLSLRTSGAYFIMITLAFGQMLYYFGISWPAYGGEDGLSIYVRSRFPGLNMMDPIQFFGVCFGVLTLVILLVRTLNNSAFGLSLNAVRQAPLRVETVGVQPLTLRLTAFVISGMIAALAGALFADLNRYISPAMLSWQLSGDIMIFVILGGVARLLGPLVGAVVFVFLGEVLGDLSDYWHIYLGLLLLLVVLFAKGGIVGILSKRVVNHDH